MLMQTTDPLTIKEALPNFTNTTHIFVPIQCSRNASGLESGFHWSLLLVSIVDGVAFHYDSRTPSNIDEAALLTNKISMLSDKSLQFMDVDSSQQQENSSDSGVYVCILMKYLLLRRLLSANAKQKVSMSMADKEVDASGGRKEMRKMIDRLRSEGRLR